MMILLSEFNNADGTTPTDAAALLIPRIPHPKHTQIAEFQGPWTVY